MEKFKWVTLGNDWEYDAFIQDGVKYHIVDDVVDEMGDVRFKVRFKVITAETLVEYRKLFNEWNQVPSKDRMKKEALEKTATSTWVGVGEPDEKGNYSRYTHTGFDIK